MKRHGLTLALAVLTATAAACEQEASRFGKLDGAGEPAGASERTLSGPMTGVYRFQDDQGVIHYVDDIGKVPPKYRKKARHPTGGAVSIVPSTSIEELLVKHGITAEQFENYAGKSSVKKPARHQDVVLYTTSWCPACKRARSYLRSRGVAFVEKDVEGSKSNLEEMLKKSGGARGVPVIDVHGQIVRGFSQSAIERALKR